LWRWRAVRKAAGKPTTTPNMVCGPVQVCWHKFARYWDVEIREVPMSEGHWFMTPEDMLERVDENTIVVVPTFGHFYNYAPVKIEYAIDRFTMEAKRLFDVLDKQLARGRYVAGEEYTIADIAIWPWFGCVALGSVYNAAEFLDAGKYTNVQRWAKDVANRHAVKRGRIVNRTSGELNEQLHERHAASDFDTNTEDKRQA
jgi:hypothetical protein